MISAPIAFIFVSVTKSMLHISHRERTLKHLIFGGASLGCLYDELDENEAKATLQRALDVGLTQFDTAPLYGGGLSESRFGQYLPQETIGRKIWLSTKCGYVIKSRDEIQPSDRVDYEKAKCVKTDKFHQKFPVAIFTRGGILESLRQSKERLQRTYIDCFRMHDTEDEDRYPEASAPGAAIDTLIELRNKGEVGKISLGMNSPEYLLRYVRKYSRGTFDNIMMAGSWNLIDQNGYELLVECQERGIKVTNVGIFASGLLAGASYYKYESNVPTHVLEKLEQWKDLCREHHLDLLHVAVSFALLPSVVENVAIGMKSVREVENNAKLFDGSCCKEVPREVWREAQDRG